MPPPRKTRTELGPSGVPPESRREYTASEIIAGKYQLVRPIATGGMGTVWVAHNLALDVRVALKLIRTDVAAPVASGRLLQEARAAAQLGHPAIVRVFDFGKSDRNDPYIVMELLDGESLAQTLERRTRLHVHRALQFLLPIADALSAAHTKQIVHRDLKPENIFLHRTETGALQPKIVDFGIARFGREDNKRLTQDGMVMGSPAYMSPEQARGQEDVDERADIWAFAVVLYESITGKLPFDAPNNFALLREVVEREPVPTVQLGAGDVELWKILARALRKDRAERWPSMRALGAALAAWLDAQGVHDDVCGASLQATWLTSSEQDRARSSFPPPPLEPSPLPLPELPAREFVTVETASMLTLPAPSKAKKLWQASFAFVITVLAISGFFVTRHFIQRETALASPRPVTLAAPAAAGAGAEEPATDEAKSQDSKEQLGAKAAASARAVASAAPVVPRHPAPIRATRRVSSAPARVHSSASELKLPY